MKIKPRNLLLMLALFLIPACFLVRVNLDRSASHAGEQSGQGLELLPSEEEMGDAIPMKLWLEQLGLDIRLAAGEQEQNGIFISKQALLKKIDPPLEPHVRDNATAMQEFARLLAETSGQKKYVYFALVPTAAGVQQQYLPQFATSQMANQQRLIEELYTQVSDTVSTVDVYSALQNRRDQYIYFRTENNLAPLGGYYTYTAIARRLGIAADSLNKYDIDYLDHAYYGDLYRAPGNKIGGWGRAYAPYREVAPDLLSVYRYTGAEREYMVTHLDDGELRVYHDLYPEHLMELGYPPNIYLGGTSAITDIQTSMPLSRKLLIFGDKTALAYLPFLCNHYQQVTIVNLYQMSAKDYSHIQPQNYDNVLFCYEIETYIHTNNLAMVQNIQWDGL